MKVLDSPGIGFSSRKAYWKIGRSDKSPGIFLENSFFSLFSFWYTRFIYFLIICVNPEKTLIKEVLEKNPGKVLEFDYVFTVATMIVYLVHFTVESC